MAKIAIMGFGTVGSGVLEVCRRNAASIARRAGEPVEVKYILDVRDFSDSSDAALFVKDINVILNDPEVKVVVETIGGTRFAYPYVRQCLESGRSVCTSNKEMVATYGAELLALAREHKAAFLFEASVGGGTPIITPMHQCLAANQISQIQGIVNGTTNFMLTKMKRENMGFDAALKIAQQLGYAETKDPGDDVDGRDACRKIAILSSLACGHHVYPDNIPARGIRDVTVEDVKAAEQLDCAIKLIKKGKAFVCELTPEEMRAYRGTLTEPGKESPYRNRSVEENLDLFMRMSKGEFPEGSKVLRAKIDMSSPNLNMRDPIIYRIMYAHHHRTGDKWCVYPMYDFAHPLSDAREGVTHSLCSLEFENHRPLYNWFVDELIEGQKPRQIEFARLNLNYTLTSKRKCLKLVQDGIVSGWDDPRMATLSGMRRRGYPPEAVRDFCERIGVSKAYSVVDFALLEACVREHLNTSAPRAMAVLDPIKLVIDNYPEDKTEALDTASAPCPLAGSCTLSGMTLWPSPSRNTAVCTRATRYGCTRPTW